MLIDETITDKTKLKSFTNLEDRFNNKHNFIYDYSESVFKGMLEPIKIYCKKHNEYFEQTPVNHLKGKYPCLKCREEGMRLSQEEFLEKAISISPQYDYTNTVYIKTNKKIKVSCHSHGEFSITPNSLLSGVGCPKCARIQANKNIAMSFSKFKEKVDLIHNNKYRIIDESYTKSTNKVDLICPTHGKITMVGTSLLQGSGCNQCGMLTTNLKTRKTFEEFLQRAKAKHGDKFTYNEKSYQGVNSKLLITCPKHGEFESTGKAHLKSDYGCTKCADEARPRFVPYYDKPTKLYYVKLFKNNKTYYKIGITVQETLNKRFRHLYQENATFEKIEMKEFRTGKLAWEIEQSILTQFKEYKTKDEIMFNNGNTEIFDIDILQHIQHYFK